MGFTLIHLQESIQAQQQDTLCNSLIFSYIDLMTVLLVQSSNCWPFQFWFHTEWSSPAAQVLQGIFHSGAFSIFLSLKSDEVMIMIAVECALSVFLVFVIPVGKGHQEPRALSKVRLNRMHLFILSPWPIRVTSCSLMYSEEFSAVVLFSNFFWLS